MTSKDYIKADLYRYSGKSYSFFLLLKSFWIPGFWFMFLFRKAGSFSKKSPLGIFYRLLCRRYSYKFGYQIPVGTKIGPGFYIGHFGAMIISPRTIIGKNCNIAHGVTIGAVMYGKRKGAPIIGDSVWFGTNSIIVGGIKIGNNVLIAPGAYVNFDVPDNSIVIGNPGKVIQKENPTEEYIKNCI
ncbi:serine O-acetyltransferase [Flavobacterium aciduliphilum]|uniref:Serine acetyltransferase n=1 Tax=Flavobacterium aciduliphilum TaxID=1101402 RepID=A0A328YJ60_9FLAO|nr:serine acetyltransferase [Flavobacterium aciduliphilum]RAR70246.1 serine O-acetyltransferase [Flavobacterium aciduliphilum]